MGLVPSELDAAFDEAEVAERKPGGTGLLPDGEYNGTVLSAEVRPGMKPWVTAELSLKLQVDEGDREGAFTFCDIELAPNTDKNGNPSKGKLGFVKQQLAGLGYTGKLSEIENATNSFLGARVAFRQKVDTHLDENGNPDQWARMNPNTNEPYIDREVYINELLQAGFAAAPAASPQFDSQVY